MSRSKEVRSHHSAMSTASLLIPALGLCLPLSGCVVVGASSSGGWFIWPGGLGLILMILLVVFILRRRG